MCHKVLMYWSPEKMIFSAKVYFGVSSDAKINVFRTYCSLRRVLLQTRLVLMLSYIFAMLDVSRVTFGWKYFVYKLLWYNTFTKQERKRIFDSMNKVFIGKEIPKIHFILFLNNPQ